MTGKEMMQGAKTWGTYALVVIASLTATFFGIQWQQTEARVDELTTNVVRIDEDFENEIEKLETGHDTDIARLDESNRTRRNDIADLEERIAVLEERTS